ncbi:hypothetical protein HNR46_004234 [Haloferula luteola]|uniref:Uncharacterized protein n=2 Tax=Haloferula luteola TaxID=595692 RepID=A0A840V8B4_9BACT|nr:hypothetical protein [Haloferula luteola]
MKGSDLKSFEPYKRFLASLQSIDEFEGLTEIAFGLTEQLLFRFPKDDVKSFSSPVPKNDELSFCVADQEVESVDLSCEWISLAECAKRTGSDLKEIEELASTGALAPVQIHPKTSEQIVIWPEAKRSLPAEKLPEPGKKSFSVKLSVKASAPLSMDVEDQSQFEETQKTFLKLAHSIGKPGEVAAKASEIANRSCFLLRWTAFEVFLRSSVHALFRKHPRILAAGNRAKKATLSFADVVSMSGDFASVDDLQHALVEREIEHGESEGQSVHGLINLLKSAFDFKVDPYSSWYVIRGEKHQTDYNTLLEVKEIRNCLVHDGGRVTSDFVDAFPNVPLCEGEIVIDDTYHLKTSLVLRAIAFRIAETIVRGNYKAALEDKKKANKTVDSTPTRVLPPVEQEPSPGQS